MAKNIAIYGLVDPRDGQLRYVGKTGRKLPARLADHMRLADARGRYSRNWLYGLKSEGLKAEIFELESVSEETWREAEKFWIAYFKSVGARLTNHSVGGDGPEGVIRTEEQRKRMSEAQRGKKLTAEHRAAIGRGLLGRKMAAEAVAKSAASRRGKAMSEAGRAALSAARRAAGTSEAQIAAIKAVHEKNRGKPRSQETRDKIAAAVKKARAAKQNASVLPHYTDK